MSTVLKYLLITPARNEVEFIELAIQSVATQEVRPIKWVIVSDGSTDGTDEIVARYMAAHSWIELLRMPERRERHFAGKVDAFNAGWAKVKSLPYSAIGSMDGDISFGPQYFSFLLERLAEDPKLGLVGTPFREASNEPYDFRFSSIEHVSGQCQLFRRECLEEIGGYVPVKGGGIDLIAVTMARMKGWKTRTFSEQVFVHHRAMGTALNGVLGARFKQGVKDYRCGGHPLWEVLRVGYQTTRRPLIIGGMALGTGYFVAAIRRQDRPIPREMVVFRRQEQILRLKNLFARLVCSGGLLRLRGVSSVASRPAPLP